MNLSTYIARRYFFARSSRNAVNIISAISILGILVGTLALIIVLSAFNGLEQLVTGFYQTFDPDLKVTPTTGKYFEPGEERLSKLGALQGVQDYSLVLEERVLFTYQDKEHIGTLKGVDTNYTAVTSIREAITHGQYRTAVQGVPAAVLGAGVSYYLGYGRISFEEPVSVFVPRSGATGSDFSNAFSSEQLYPAGIFSVQPEFDEEYAITSLGFVRKLLNRSGALSAIEVKTGRGASPGTVQKEIQGLFGDGVEVKDRAQQQAIFMKVMKSESLFTFLVFALILSIATFTIMGSLSMMMLDKKDHLRTLWAMGTDISSLRAIFFKEGMLISGLGAIIGLVLGVLVVLGQQYFGWLSLGQGYVVDAYPVVLRFRDIVLVLCTVGVLCSLSSWLTSRRLSLQLITSISD